MQEIRFQRAAPWCSPQYKKYAIRDRYIGRDRHGNACYEYALFRLIGFESVCRFRTRKQAYQYVSDLTGLSRWDIGMRSSSIILNDRDYLGVISGNTMYRITKKTREVSKRPVEDEQITGWFDKYSECLSEAKEIIRAGFAPAERTAK